MTAAQEPSFRISQTGKGFVAKAALDVLVGGLNESSGMVAGLDVPQSATFIQTLSRYDQLTRSRTYARQALAAFTAFHKQYPGFSPETIRWGLAAYYASTVYDGQNQTTFLDGAMAAWEIVYPFQLTPGIASSGHFPSINATFQPTCNASSVQGAVLWLGRDDEAKMQVDAQTMGPFITLSSYLYNHTHNSTYSEAANLAIEFTRNFLSNGKITYDTFDLFDCTLDNGATFMYNSGYFIEGLATYSAMTGDDSQMAYLDSLVASLLQNSSHLVSHRRRASGSEDAYGRIKGIEPDPQTIENSRLESDWKAIYINGLYTCLRFNLLTTANAEAVRGLIAVQYNAIRELASSTVNNQIVYSPSSNSQPLQSLTTWGQLAAAEVLTLALNVTTDSDSTSDSGWISMLGSPSSTFGSWASGPTEVPPPPVERSASSRVGVIAGAVTGGAVAASVILIVAVLCWAPKGTPHV
ncbi:hypothetical protein PENSPDRAFT_693904 [Peniophora sp. CONT]|nr:hypothetical protein PENSPDRAFT_693904 [Peniophora sp. CONT]